jgi:preprotein translocase subunit SecE
MAEAKNWIEGTKDYINDLKLEMRRVSWPNRKQVEGTTAVVIVSVFAFAGYFAIVDGILSQALNRVFAFFK